MNRELAETTIKEAHEFAERLSESIRRTAASGLSTKQLLEYRRLAGTVSAYLYTELLQPLVADDRALQELALNYGSQRDGMSEEATAFITSLVSDLRDWLTQWASKAGPEAQGYEERLRTIERAVERLTDFVRSGTNANETT